MKQLYMKPGWFLMVVVVTSIFGCGDFDEMKGQRSLIEANKLVEQGDEQSAEKAFAELVAKYPNTRASETASKQLIRIQRQREFRERKEFAKILESYKQVLNGYHALYAQYPDSLAALDNSEYFFDAAYLDEITPEGYQVYLWLKDSGSRYSIWCVADDKQRGYAIESASRVLVGFDREEMMAYLNTNFQLSPWSYRLIALQSVSPVEESDRQQ